MSLQKEFANHAKRKTNSNKYLNQNNMVNIEALYNITYVVNKDEFEEI